MIGIRAKNAFVRFVGYALKNLIVINYKKPSRKILRDGIKKRLSVRDKPIIPNPVCGKV